jgi:hypothetical protein
LTTQLGAKSLLMKLRNRGLIRLAAMLGSGLIQGWMGTLRYRLAPEAAAIHPGKPWVTDRFIYAFWHESILFPTGLPTRRGFMALISQHADGELIAQVAQRLGVRAVRGSTTRGGAAALRELTEDSAGCHILVTPDGPRGPRRRVQPGAVFLASRTGLPIVPVGVGFANAWRAGSWDRFAVPKPFSTVTGVPGDLVRVPPDLNRDDLEPYRQRLEAALLRATASAEAWAQQLRGGAATEAHASRHAA